ncbi:MAG: hypothetical protein K8R40_08490 [Anaerolineaceae bacterium]|nr:hypothetical protein [Anaerolineaceae bacterium]
MNITNKKMLLVLTVALLIVTPVLFLLGFLRTGIPAAMACYGLVLASLAAVLRASNGKLRKFSLEALILIPAVYILIAPNIVLSEAITAGGYEYFLNEMLTTYIYLIGAALLILIFSSAIYAKEKGLDTGKLKFNLFSILSIALYVRLYWLIMIETAHLVEFSARMPHLKVEYVVLGGIPLFAAILILTLRKNLLGYILGAVAGLPHMVLVAFQFLTRFSRATELGGATSQTQAPTIPINAIAVFFSSLVIFVLCLKGIKDNGPKLSESERSPRGLKSIYNQAAVAMMLLHIAQIVKDFSELFTLSKDTGSPIGVLTFVVSGLLVVAMVMAVLKIKWGLVLGIIAGAWMLILPAFLSTIGVQLDQSVEWFYLLAAMIPGLLLIYFCVLAWKKVLPQKIN